MIIYWREEDDAFVVEVPELPGCAADGATYEEAVANAKISIAEWIETARALGRPIPDTVEEIAQYWGNSDIKEIHSRIAEWASTKRSAP